MTAQARSISRSQCGATSSRRHSCRPIAFGHNCFDSATPMASALRSVWSEPSPIQSPSARETTTGSTSPDVSGPSTCRCADCVNCVTESR